MIVDKEKVVSFYNWMFFLFLVSFFLGGFFGYTYPNKLYSSALGLCFLIIIVVFIHFFNKMFIN